MPVYNVVRETNNEMVGSYNAQRPSTAAKKAFTTLRKRQKTLVKETFFVYTESRIKPQKFVVEYMESEDEFLGRIKRPVATRIEFE